MLLTVESLVSKRRTGKRDDLEAPDLSTLLPRAFSLTYCLKFVKQLRLSQNKINLNTDSSMEDRA